MSAARGAGFTLLELLVTLVIMMLAVSLVAPRFGEALPGVQLKAETRKVAALLRHARSQAVVLNQEIRITLTEDPVALNISTQTKPYLPPAEVHLALTAGHAGGETEQPGQQGDVIRFFAEGHSSGGTITLSQEGGKQTSINIDWLTGRVSING